MSAGLRRPATTAAADHLPRLPRAYVPRRRLWEHLDAAAEGAATLLVGPGGAGKTLGVTGWLRQSGRTTGTTWVRADASWTPARLLALLAGDRLVVVDDAHQLPATTIRALDSRLDRDPESLRLVLLSRWDLPITRLSAELLGQYTVLRGDLLRLDEEESAALVAAHVPSEADEVARIIADRTQGWCAAVVMTARAVAAAADPVALARQYAAEGTAVADRVASEVFATLQPRQRHLLLCVGAEPVVTPVLAVHLTHDPAAGEALAELEAMGLLVTRLPATEDPDLVDTDVPAPEAEHQARYAIHPLLAEVVRRRTAAGGADVLRAAATVQHAVRLDVDRGATADAFRRLVAIGDHLGAAELLADVGPTLLLRGHADGVNTWSLAHPSAVDVTPGSWFSVALERWCAGEIACARHWMDRMLAGPLPETGASALQLAIVRLMRSRLGLEPLGPAVEHARAVLAGDQREDADALVPILLGEIAASENWLGRLDSAAETLSAVLQLSRARDLGALTAVALSHLAFNEFMAGHEASAMAIADEVLAIAPGQPWRVEFSRDRARMVRELALLTDLPNAELGRAIDPASELPMHAGDPTSRFWARLRLARLALAAGSLSDAERALEVPIETPDLPAHLWTALVLERALLTALAGDQAVLVDLQEQLEARGLSGEAAFVAALRADLRGDRRGAAARFEKAAEQAECPQPPVRALALVGAAQLRDELGDGAAARELLRDAIVATQVRRNAVPFLGWPRHGTPVSVLLDRQARQHPAPWTTELVDVVHDRAGLASYFGPSVAAPGERADLPSGTIAPVLSPRERDVLHELARGSTYADIAANLFVSENTVKTHVSSLYGKLSVNRRSAALAAARNLHLL